jgi:hypothetical protein
VIFQRKVARPSYEVTRAGWNDGAVAQWYESGYAGGLVFHEKQQADLSQRAVISRPLPRCVPAA